MWYESLKHFKPNTDFSILFIIHLSPSFFTLLLVHCNQMKNNHLHGPFLCLDYLNLSHFQNFSPTILHDLINLTTPWAWNVKDKCPASITFLAVMSMNCWISHWHFMTKAAECSNWFLLAYCGIRDLIARDSVLITFTLCYDILLIFHNNQKNFTTK